MKLCQYQFQFQSNQPYTWLRICIQSVNLKPRAFLDYCSVKTQINPRYRQLPTVSLHQISLQKLFKYIKWIMQQSWFHFFSELVGYQVAGIYASLLYTIYLLPLYYNSVFQSGDYKWSYTLLPLPLFVNQPPY